MKRLLLLSALAPAVVLLACATDNGDAVHGPQFGPTPERPDAGALDGSVDPPEQEGGPGPSDAAADGDAPPSSCTAGTVAVLAGGDTTLSAAAQVAGGAWSGAAVAGSAAKSEPAVVAFGAGFLALTRGPADALQSLGYGGAWSAASTVGTATTVGPPALAVVGAKAHAVYLAGGTPKVFFRAENGGASWGVTAEPVVSSGTQSFGQSAGAVSAAGTELVFAQDGGDNDGLFTQKYDGTWSAGAPVLGAGTLTSAPPALVGVDGAIDSVLVYADNTVNHVIGYATRSATTKTWGTAAVTNALAQTADRPSIARVSTSGLVVVFRGNDQRPYTMKGTIAGASVSWTAPVALLADASTVDGPPAVAKGVCGDEAIVVFASGGIVKATRFRGSSWTVPEAVTGAAGTRVAVATR
jgi:hypothetical protein